MVDYSTLTVNVTSLREERYRLIEDEENDCDVVAESEWLATAYVNDNELFDSWMSANMSRLTSHQLKFNGGNPMMLIHFGTKADAMLFKLTWYTDRRYQDSSCDSCQL